MKTSFILALILFLIMIFLPFASLMDTEKKDTDEPLNTQQTERTKVNEETVSVLKASSGKVSEMNVKDYLFGAVSAEIPASYHEEAIKAQAVACYTYMKWIKENADNPNLHGADISDNAQKHQGFLSENELKEKWGASYEIYSEKIKNAIDSVLGEYLEYENETAMSVYHALSPGMTQSAEKIWGNDVPYLRSVTAPGDKLSPDYTSEVVVKTDVFKNKLNELGANLKEESTEDLKMFISTYDNNFFKEINIGSENLDANDLRSAFSLNSPTFRLTADNDDVRFTVYGKGHGIGMSQYSADYMARQGSTYKEILAHFYTGTTLIKAQ